MSYKNTWRLILEYMEQPGQNSPKLEELSRHPHLTYARGRCAVVGDGQVCLKLPADFPVLPRVGLRCSEKARGSESWPLWQGWAAHPYLSMAAGSKVTVGIINLF